SIAGRPLTIWMRDTSPATARFTAPPWTTPALVANPRLANRSVSIECRPRGAWKPDMSAMDKCWRFAVWVTIAAVLCGCTDDVVDASYSTQAEAEKAGAVEHGWVPAWVPPEARQ